MSEAAGFMQASRSGGAPRSDFEAVLYVEPGTPPEAIRRSREALLTGGVPPERIHCVGAGQVHRHLLSISWQFPRVWLLRAGLVPHPKGVPPVLPDDDLMRFPLLFWDELSGGETPQTATADFRPDWNPDLAHARPYGGEAFFLSSTLLSRVSSLPRAGSLAVPGLAARTLFWDLFLQTGESFPDLPPRRIPGFPLWRPAKVLDHCLEEAAQEDALLRRTLRFQKGACFQRQPGGEYRWQFPVCDESPLVSLVIPTRDGLEVLRPCVESILAHTSRPTFEILIADNGSAEPATFEFFRAMEDRGVRVVPCPGPFNFSRINNSAARAARGKLLAFLNNDIEVQQEDWLWELAQHALRPEIGAVGAQLLYPDGRIQHAGVVCGVGHVAAHAFRFFLPTQGSMGNRLQSIQNYSAVTAACLVVRRSLFQEIGGFDEEHLAISNNDVDLCLRLREAGYQNLYTPYSVLLHHESATRGGEYDNPEKKRRYENEVRYMKRRWKSLLQDDPAYHPLLTRQAEDFSLAPAFHWA